MSLNRRVGKSPLWKAQEKVFTHPKQWRVFEYHSFSREGGRSLTGGKSSQPKIPIISNVTYDLYLLDIFPKAQPSSGPTFLTLNWGDLFSYEFTTMKLDRIIPTCGFAFCLFVPNVLLLNFTHRKFWEIQRTQPTEILWEYFFANINYSDVSSREKLREI